MTQPPHTQAHHYVIGAARFETAPPGPGLYIVATPIGNLGDITLRALSTLASTDLILCEDTRTTAKLLERYGIRTRTAPYHEHNAEKVRPGILDRLKDGASIALVSDAGTPLVSDPGYRLVKEAVERGIVVTACPGPSAVLTGLALSGLPTDRFVFAGFVPQRQGERRKVFIELAAIRSTLIFFDSPHRIIETLHDLQETLSGRTIAVSRELTKLHEEVLRGTPAEIAGTLAERPAIKGEITLVIGPPLEKQVVSEEVLDAAIDETLAVMPASKAAADVARRLGLNKADVYARILALKAGNGA